MLHTQAYTEYLLYVFKAMFSQHIWHIKPKKTLLLILCECISSNFTLAWMCECVIVNQLVNTCLVVSLWKQVSVW
jgi:hypothetical protein